MYILTLAHLFVEVGFVGLHTAQCDIVSHVESTLLTVAELPSSWRCDVKNVTHNNFKYCHYHSSSLTFR